MGGSQSRQFKEKKRKEKEKEREKTLASARH